MKTKFSILISSIFFIFLLNSVSAVVVYGDWQDSSQSIQIQSGQTIDFNSDFFSLSPPMNVNIKLYDSTNHLVYSFENNKVVNANGFAQTYSITSAIYKTAGNFQVILSASDKFPSSDSHTLNLVVNQPPQNHAPVITSTPVTQVNEKTNYAYQVTATDADNDALIYSLTQSPSWLSINSQTGLVSGTAISVNSDTSFDIIVQVSDGKGGSATQTYVLTIKNIIPQNNPPVITSTPITQVNEESSYVYQVTATDADNDSLAYSLTQAPSWLSMSSSGLVSGTAPAVTSDTPFNVTIVVSDGKGGSATQTYVLTVKNVIVPNNPPVANNQSVTTNKSTPVDITLTATDADSNPLTFSVVSNPLYGTLSNFNSSTGKVTYTPNTGFVGEDSFTFKANDGIANSNTATVSITVKDVVVPNHPPVITSTPVTKVEEKDNYLYQVTATDADNDVLVYSLTQYPTWLSINTQTGLITGTAPAVTSDTPFNVTIVVSDGKGGSATQTYVLTVKKDDNDDDEDDDNHHGGKSSRNRATIILDQGFETQKYLGQFASKTTVIEEEQKVQKKSLFGIFLILFSLLCLALLLVLIIMLVKRSR